VGIASQINDDLVLKARVVRSDTNAIYLIHLLNRNPMLQLRN